MVYPLEFCLFLLFVLYKWKANYSVLFRTSFFLSSAAKTYMKDTVKNLLNKRKQENNKEEKLFIDSILDCDLMDEEEVAWWS